MKWFVFTGAVVVSMIALGILAVDERDVVWEGEIAKCGYCRADLRSFSVVCPTCDRSVDWTSKSEECTWCLLDEDADEMRDLFEQLELDEEPLPGALASFPMAYFLSMDEGSCTYCGGMGTVLDGDAKRDCTVCRGDKRCVGCGGDRVRVRGDENAHIRALDRLLARRRVQERSVLTDRPIVPSRLLDEDVTALRGFVEADQLRDGRGRPLRALARERLEKAFKALHEELRNARPERSPN